MCTLRLYQLLLYLSNRRNALAWTARIFRSRRASHNNASRNRFTTESPLSVPATMTDHVCDATAPTLCCCCSTISESCVYDDFFYFFFSYIYIPLSVLRLRVAPPPSYYYRVINYSSSPPPPKTISVRRDRFHIHVYI